MRMRIALVAAILAVAGAGWWARPHPGPTPARVAAGVPSASPLASSPEPAVLPSSTPAPVGAITPARLLIPKLGVDAPVETKGIDARHIMQSPDKPTEVAWYPFTAKPGAGTNAVFSGHLDDATVGPAVFWRLGDLKPGDTVSVRDDASAELTFSVSSVNVYPLNSAPVQEIIGPTSSSAVTLITCAGSYNRQSGLYDKRLVVRARQV
jgi:LPXTG-site transpeptidase (sortase) family protein